jgi:hypothetical protein
MVEVGEDDFRIQPAARQIPQRGQERVPPRLVLGGTPRGTRRRASPGALGRCRGRPGSSLRR